MLQKCIAQGFAVQLPDKKLRNRLKNKDQSHLKGRIKIERHTRILRYYVRQKNPWNKIEHNTQQT
jgi:hypothetical protein